MHSYLNLQLRCSPPISLPNWESQYKLQCNLTLGRLNAHKFRLQSFLSLPQTSSHYILFYLLCLLLLWFKSPSIYYADFPVSLSPCSSHTRIQCSNQPDVLWSLKHGAGPATAIVLLSSQWLATTCLLFCSHNGSNC